MQSRMGYMFSNSETLKRGMSYIHDYNPAGHKVKCADRKSHTTAHIMLRPYAILKSR